MSFTFGAAKPATPTSAFNFGTNTNQSGFGSFGQSGFGGQSTQPGQSTQQSSLAQSSQAPSSQQILISKYTKFNDLPQDVQNKLSGLHKKVQEGKIQSLKISTKYTASQLKHLKNKHVNDKLLQKVTSIGSKIKSDLEFVKQKLKKQSIEQANQTEVAVRIFEAMMRNGGVGSISVTENALGVGEGDPIWMFFVDFTQQAYQHVQQYRRVLEEMEQQLISTQQQQSSNVQQLIPSVLKVNFDALVQLSSKVSMLHQQVDQVKELYAQWRKVTTLDNSNDPLIKLQSNQSDNKPANSQDLFRKSTYQEMSQRIQDVPQTQTQTPAQPPSQLQSFGQSVPSFSFGKK